jgi:hypothetical protein
MTLRLFVKSDRGIARGTAEEPNTMIRNGDLLRFTSSEIEEFRSVGVDVAGVRTIEDFGAAVATWCDLLGEVRPDLLDKIAHAMADARGVKLPPKLKVYDSGTGEGES